MEKLIMDMGMISSFDGTDLFFSKDIPEDRRAIIIIVHGFCEHSGRYEYVKNKFIQYGYGVYRFDNRGHGKSKGERGHIKDFNHFIKDTDVIVDMAIKENEGLPVFILGHSMGGFITASYGIKYKNKVRGQILSGAATLEPQQIKGITGSFLKLANKFIPKLKIKNSLGKYLCRDEDVVKDYETDPLNLKRATAKLYTEFLIRGIRWLNDNLHKYEYPCFIIHGGEDKIVDKEASINFFTKISSKDKEIKIYDGMYHECLNEKEKDMVIEDIHKWIENRI